jgi:hypothetical protein
MFIKRLRGGNERKKRRVDDELETSGVKTASIEMGRETILRATPG